MKLTGKLKEQVEKANSKDEKKALIKDAGMLLSDDELSQVAGGDSIREMILFQCRHCTPPTTFACPIDALSPCPICGSEDVEPL